MEKTLLRLAFVSGGVLAGVYMAYYYIIWRMI